MLRVRQRSEPARLLDDRDRAAAMAICDQDRVSNVFVASRIRALGLEPGRLGAQLWGFEQNGQLTSLCYAGANLVPVQATSAAVVAFADRALRQGRRCSSIVGPSAAVTELWRLLRPHWGPARDVRAAQPLMAIDGPPEVAADPAVRRVRSGEIDILMPACIAMFTEEVGVSPLAGDGGAAYRARVTELIRTGRARHGRRGDRSPADDLPGRLAVRQRLQHRGPRHLPPRGLPRNRRVHVGPLLVR